MTTEYSNVSRAYIFMMLDVDAKVAIAAYMCGVTQYSNIKP